MPKKNLPIVWYLDESQLPDDRDKANKIKRVAEAIIAWEADGTQSLNDLRDTIDGILKQ